MAKIQRYDGDLKAFASNATGTNRTVFGDVTQSNLLDDNINADFLTGWEIVGPSDSPTRQDFNALAFTTTQLLAYLHQVGVAEWNATQEYHQYSLTNRNGKIFSCKTNSHVSATPPEEDSINWEVFDGAFNSMAELIANSDILSDGQIVYLSAFHEGIPTGLNYKVNRTGDLTTHNGGTIVDVSNTADLSIWDSAEQTAWFTAGVGTGILLEAVVGEEINVKWFGAKCDGVSSDVQPAEAASSINGGFVFDGELTLDSTVSLGSPIRPTIRGIGTNRQSGSTLPKSTIVWTGGALPFFSQSGAYYTFRDFAIENRGTASYFLELNAGAIGNKYINLDMLAGSGHTQFSGGVIKSNGNRMGYSVFLGCQISSPADVLIDIDGQGTGNGITPILFDERCIFDCTTASTNFTIVKVKDEVIEQLIFNNCTFNRQANAGDFTIVDTTDTPTSPAINNLIFNQNELDISPTGSLATHRLFKLTNVDLFKFSDNKCNLGGQMTAMADLVNSKAICYNNDYASIDGPLFDCDSSSKVFNGVNYPNTSNTKGVTNNAASVGIELVPYQASMALNPQLYDAGRNTVFRIDVTDGAGWEVVMSSTQPLWVTPGQFFTVQVRNVSGGAISAGTFGNGFVTGVPTTAPTNGNHVTYQFYWDGTVAQPVSGVAPTEVSNT